MQTFIHQFGFTVSILLSVVSCEKNEVSENFINKYGDDNFDEFLGFTVYYRSSDESGNLLYFANLHNDTCESPLIVKVDKDSKNVKSSDFSLIDMHCEGVLIDTVRVKFLVQKFLKYEIPYLEVTNDSIVQISATVMERPNIFRYPVSFSPEQLNEFKFIEGRWYSKSK